MGGWGQCRQRLDIDQTFRQEQYSRQTGPDLVQADTSLIACCQDAVHTPYRVFRRVRHNSVSRVLVDTIETACFVHHHELSRDRWSALDGIHLSLSLGNHAHADGCFNIVRCRGLILELYEYLVA